MKINNSYKLFAFTVFLLLIIAVIFVLKALDSQNDVAKSEEHRFRSVMLAIELFQSSEDLTRMARSYVATGNPIYKKNYFEILDIRNGKRQRPQNYPVTYWHLAGVGKGPVVSLGETIALQDLMRREGVTENEFSLLHESQAHSDHLVIMEKKAFAALDGMFDDGHGNFTVRRTPDRNYAVGLLSSEEYSDEKAGIMLPIQQFMEALDNRTNDELSADQSKLQQYIFIIFVLIVILIIVVIIKFIHTFRRILYPVELLRRQVAEIASGNYTARCNFHSSNEIGELCANFNSMADSLQTDIAERIRAEEKNLQLASIIESSDDAIIGKTSDSIITSWNTGAEKMYGYTKDEVINKPISLIIPPDHQDEMNQILEKIRNGQHVDNYETVRLKKDGTQINVSVSISSMYDGKGICVGASSIARDITERKLTEEALHASEDKFRLLLNSTAEAIYGIDLDGNCTFCNNACIQMLGYKNSDELLGKNMHWQIHSKYADGTRFPVEECRIFRAFQKGENSHVDDEVLWRADGSCFKAEYWSYPQRRVDKIVGSVVTFLDITERKKAESELRKLSRAVEQSPASIVITDTKGAIEYVNPKFIQLTGYSLEEAIGKNPRILKSGEKPSGEYKQLWDMIASGSEWRGEFHNKKKNGELYWESAVISPVKDMQGNVTHFLAVKEDITHRKQIEEEREKLIAELQKALADVKTLGGLIPICANCKKIRDDKGYWNILEAYLMEHSDAEFTHGICPECAAKLYPDYKFGQSKGQEKK